MSHTIVCGLGYGDEGKGAIVDALVRDALGSLPLVVRFNGGGQAAHNVHVRHSGHHTFSQLGSGSLRLAPTHLSKDFLFNPVTFLKELAEFRDKAAIPHITIDPMAKIVTPYHMLANGAREHARGNGRHGSCGQGIGELMADSLNPKRAHLVIRAGMLLHAPDRVKSLLSYWRDRKAEDTLQLSQSFFAENADMFDPASSALKSYRADFEEVVQYLDVVPDEQIVPMYRNIVFEGAQGLLLDEDFGFHPHTTWSHTTPRNARKLSPDAKTVGVIRTFMTRHGAGPFVTEDNSIQWNEHDNGTGEYQGAFRFGHFDLVALKYALLLTGVDELAVTHLDYLMGKKTVKVCTRYDNIDFIPVLPPDDFEARERLTAALHKAKPIYEEWSARSFLDQLQDELARAGHRIDYQMLGWGLTLHYSDDYTVRLESGQDGYGRI